VVYAVARVQPDEPARLDLDEPEVRRSCMNPADRPGWTDGGLTLVCRMVGEAVHTWRSAPRAPWQWLRTADEAERPGSARVNAGSTPLPRC